MTLFSANLGFLWTELPLPDAIRAAAKAGFDAVECHWPYNEDPLQIKAALDETGLPMLGLNTRKGAPGENGLAALPGREDVARAAIDEAIDYAAAIGAQNVHVMAGLADGGEAHATYIANLRYAASEAAARGLTVLIEPLNAVDAPGYFLNTTDQAVTVIETLAVPNLKLMFDCYHVQISEGDLCNRISALMPHIGHIQFAAVPGRGTPDQGEVNYPFVFAHIADCGYQAPLGAEYRPVGRTEDSLGWLREFRGPVS